MDTYYMKLAIEEARRAAEMNEVPVGAVVVLEDEVIGRGHNLTHTKRHPVYHAEMMAIDEAVKRTGDLRLPDATLYVTLEPCSMCAGAILLARFRRVVIGAMDPKHGACGSVVDLLSVPRFNHHPEVTTGVEADECSELLRTFFRRLREQK